MKKLCSVLLALCLALLTLAPAFAAETPAWDAEVKTTCGGHCGQSPLIIVPGIMQSQVYVQDENGNDLMTSDGFPIVEGMDLAFMFDMVALKQELKAAVGDILKYVLRRDQDGLLDLLLGILDESFSNHYFNPDGTRVNEVAVDEYWYSLAEAKNHPDKSYNYAKGYAKDDDGNTLPTTKYKTEFDFIKAQVDITEFCEQYGYDHTYYYSYSSFGDTDAQAARLAEYIDMVKAQTGHDKVSLVFISLGGTIGNVFLSKYCDPSEIDRIVYAAAAVDGSYLLGDLMHADSTLKDNAVIYNDLIPNIVALAAEEYMALAYAGNTLARAIPNELFNEFLNEAVTRGVNEVLGRLMHNCPSMWATVPGALYPSLSAQYISDQAHAPLKEKTDRYYEIQSNIAATLQRLQAGGMQIFVICGYGLELPALIAHYKLSSDNIIQAQSTSIGGTFANVGETLPADYVPAIDASYLSPDGVVDAGTCALPDHTWFVSGQSHLKLQASVNDVIGQCVQLITDPEITDAREHNGGYPQFNEYRDLSQIERMMRLYDEADQDALSAKKREAVEAAYADAQALMEKRVWSYDEAKAVEKEFYEAMQKAKLLGDKDQNSFVKYTLLPLITKLMKAVSDVFERILGGQDYWLIPVRWFK
ncbi:MAG: hypothetical protein IK080_00155 [Clostridia bacterium]|nr:hypothetical protein [Clostridia bacterium]